MKASQTTEGKGDEIAEVLKGLREWRRQHPKATLAEIERETMKRMAQVQAQIMEELSQGLPAEGEKPAGEILRCPECGAKMQRRGQVERQLHGTGGQVIHLQRSYWVCPRCGAGIFPPG